MSDQQTQRSNFEQRVGSALRSINEILGAVAGAQHLTADNVNQAFDHLQHYIGLMRDRALTENAVAAAGVFSLDNPIVPSTPYIQPAQAPRLPRVSPSQSAPTFELVPVEGKTTLRVRGELPPETGTAPAVGEPNVSFLDE